MDAAGVRPQDIDFIAFATTTPDLVFPNCGVLLQQRLGIGGCPAFSLEAACSGFIYALSVADKFIRFGESKCALVVFPSVIQMMDRNLRWTTDLGNAFLAQEQDVMDAANIFNIDGIKKMLGEK